MAAVQDLQALVEIPAEMASTLITKFLQSGHLVGRQVATADKAGADRK